MKMNIAAITILIILIIFNIVTFLFLLNEVDFLKYKNEEKDKDTLIVQIILSIFEKDHDFLTRYFNINLESLTWKDNVIDEFYIIKESGEYLVYFKNDFVLYINLENDLDKNKKNEYKIKIGKITGGEEKRPYNKFPKGAKFHFIGKYKIYEH